MLNVVHDPQKGGVFVCRRADGLIAGTASRSRRKTRGRLRGAGQSRLRGAGQARLGPLREDAVRVR